MNLVEFLAMAGVSATILAIVAWGAERRRVRRKNLDRVGWVPWTALFFWALLAAIMLLGLAVKARLTG